MPTLELNGWDTTNPKKHNPDLFRYIVHGIDDRSTIVEQGASEVLGEWHTMFNDFFGEQEKASDPLTNPEAFLKKRFISCSVIDQDHYETYGTYGLILKVPRSNILIASPVDIGTIYTEDYISGWLKTNPVLPTASEMLEASYGYNEVVITGQSTENTRIRIMGGFIKSADIDETQRIESFTRIHRIPLIDL